MCAGWEAANPNQLDWVAEEFGYLDGQEAKQVINTPLITGLRWVEGVLIRGFEKNKGRRPLWNRNSGAEIKYSVEDLARARELLKAVAFLKSDYLHLTSHCSMIELSVNSTHLAFEGFLHAARLGTRVGHSLEEACEAIPDYGHWKRIQDVGYLRKMPKL